MDIASAIYKKNVVKTDETRDIEKRLNGKYSLVECYRHHSASIRLLVIDPQFKNMNQVERFHLVEKQLLDLPQDLRDDINFQLLLAPGEEHDFRYAMRYQEFVDETPSGL